MMLFCAARVHIHRSCIVNNLKEWVTRTCNVDDLGQVSLSIVPRCSGEIFFVGDVCARSDQQHRNLIIETIEQ
jgi:hypothetical protein